MFYFTFWFKFFFSAFETGVLPHSPGWLGIDHVMQIGFEPEVILLPWPSCNPTLHFIKTWRSNSEFVCDMQVFYQLSYLCSPPGKVFLKTFTLKNMYMGDLKK